MSGLGPRPHVHTRVMSAAVASSDGKRPILSMHCHSTQKWKNSGIQKCVYKQLHNYLKRLKSTLF